MGFIHESRVRFLAHYGYTEFDVCGAALIQYDAAVVFKSQVFYGEVIDMAVTVKEFTTAGCDFFYLLTNGETGKRGSPGQNSHCLFRLSDAEEITSSRSV